MNEDNSGSKFKVEMDEFLAYNDKIQWTELGDNQPLIEYLESGGEIGPQLRAFFVRLLKLGEKGIRRKK